MFLFPLEYLLSLSGPIQTPRATRTPPVQKNIYIVKEGSTTADSNNAKKTKAIIKQNMAWALVYNIGALPLAMAGHVEPWQAALGMSISSLVVVLNSFLLRFVLPAASKSKKISRLHVG